MEIAGHMNAQDILALSLQCNTLSGLIIQCYFHFGETLSEIFVNLARKSMVKKMLQVQPSNTSFSDTWVFLDFEFFDFMKRSHILRVQYMSNSACMVRHVITSSGISFFAQTDCGATVSRVWIVFLRAVIFAVLQKDITPSYFG